ncbi:SIMPL domain-containing protein [Clostridium pascui]|uniref:SIMPL domain-containing protein n=1 Tax=Clostridium pascui TaxID=46609 RepID=UPI00195C38AC|nr:SIMPL domain-containing protein [Clostridium pascui]
MMNYDLYSTNAQSLKKGELKINGTATIKIEPNIAIVNLGVVTEDINLEKAQRENAIKVTSIINELLKFNIPKQDISTFTYNIEPQYDYIEGKQIFRGYRVTNILSVTIRDLPKVGQIIDAAVYKGANRVDNIKFTVENPSPYYSKALSLAIINAVNKARQVENTLKVNMFKIPYKIIEQSSTENIREVADFKVLAATTPILPGQITITSNIEAFFYYKY